jgi:hypothetical protein
VNGFITEYAIRVVYTPGQTGRITEYQHHLADARAAYDHEVDFHGADAVEFLTRQVRRTEWVAGKLPPKVDRDGGLCDPILHEKPIRDITTGGLL